MRVVAKEAFRFFYNHVPIDVSEGEAVDSDVAVFLLNTRAAVRPDDEDARALAEELGLDVADDGQEQQLATPPPPPVELNIDAPVKDVLDWVGADPARAAQVLELEKAKPQPRSTLIVQLEKTAAASA
ncbi:hypothetical protein JHN63_01880 [Streptomyces sp. MBT65]|uniref:hypothetical protein n=1 Tax=Streptomyces sp. MBT65 TaxID=1488395 RepID=UPI00190AA2DF|nr:hypothetical protein [Streptomyces sp. MBT65]MBK3572591.1 hypothetical protein [Streptomyces sp. MBT65]